MNKRNVRSFALGILFAAILMGSSTFLLEEKTSKKIDEAKEIVEEEGFIVVSKEEYENLTAQEQKKEVDKEEEKVEENPSKEGSNLEEENPSEEDSDTEEEDVVSFQLEIKSGMNTEEISSILESANIIDDGQSFEQFLIEHNYNKMVQVGLFELNNQMSYEEISKIITKS